MRNALTDTRQIARTKLQIEMSRVRPSFLSAENSIWYRTKLVSKIARFKFEWSVFLRYSMGWSQIYTQSAWRTIRNLSAFTYAARCSLSPFATNATPTWYDINCWLRMVDLICLSYSFEKQFVGDNRRPFLGKLILLFPPENSFRRIQSVCYRSALFKRSSNFFH